MHFRLRPYKITDARTLARRACIFVREMRSFNGVLLLLLISKLAAPTPIFDKDGASAGFQGRHRSTGGFGETIRDWFRVLKNRIVGKWQEWFGDNPLPRLSPQDILNIDKALESRIQNYPGFLLDLSKLSFDSKQDWGIRVGNWYVIRKITGGDYDSDSDSDEWEFRPLMPKLPSLHSILTNIDWPDMHGFDVPRVTQSPTTTPKTRFTYRQETPQTVTTSSVTQSNATESTVMSTERVNFTSSEVAVTSSSQSVATVTESTLTSEQRPDVVSVEPTVSGTDFTDTAATFAEPIVTSAEPPSISKTTVTSDESITTVAKSTLTSAGPNAISIELTVPTTEVTAIPTKSISTLTKPSVTSTEEILIPTTAVVTNDESIATKPTLTSVRSIVISTESTVPAIEFSATPTSSNTEISTELNVVPTRSIVPSVEPVASTVQSTVISTEPIFTLAESTTTSTESSKIATDQIATATESLAISTEFTLPVLNKRIEDNETVSRRTKKPSDRPASAEVVMF